MLDGDVLCRAVLYPKQWRQGVYSPEASLPLGERNHQGSFALSFGSRYLLRDVNGAHLYGVETANLSNKGLMDRLGRELTEEEKQQYVAFYDIIVGEIRQINPEMHMISICWKPEHGRDEHFEIQISELPSAMNRSRKERTRERTRILGGLVARLWGPCMWLKEIELSGSIVPVSLPIGNRGGCCGYKERQ